MGVTVRSWMTPEPVCVEADAAALEALDLMVDRGVRHLPVVEDGRRVIGILSIDDLRGAFPVDVGLRRPPAAGDRRRLLDATVADAMTWAPLTVHAEAPLEEAARTLSAARVGCLPVVEERERLVGILSETDLLRALIALLRGEIEPGSALPELEALTAELRAERRRLLRRVDDWQEAERALSADIREEPRDSADRAIDERDVLRLAPLSERATRRLAAIDAALERAEQGRLGVCERCGGRIPPTRLRAIPEALLCVRCARLEETGQTATPPRG